MDTLSSTSTSGSSFFNKVASDPSSLGKAFLGPNYQYAKWIRTPSELGMSSSADALADNIAGLMDYVGILSEGGGPASKNDGQPLGDRYFITTGGQCKTGDGQTVARSLYINNIPDGTVPFLAEMGVKMSSFKGLVPGILGDLDGMNPVHLFSAFMQSSTPACSNIHMKTIDENNKAGTGSGFVVNTEVANIAPCAFVDGKNPISGESCTEAFEVANDKLRRRRTKPSKKMVTLKGKPFANLYTALIGGLLVYIVYRLINKK